MGKVLKKRRQYGKDNNYDIWEYKDSDGDIWVYDKNSGRLLFVKCNLGRDKEK